MVDNQGLLSLFTKLSRSLFGANNANSQGTIGDVPILQHASLQRHFQLQVIMKAHGALKSEEANEAAREAGRGALHGAAKVRLC